MVLKLMIQEMRRILADLSGFKVKVLVQAVLTIPKSS